MLTDTFQVLLRVLEYYRGIMILTTNRIAVFYPAIKYQPLSTETRLNLRRNFLQRANKRIPLQDYEMLEEDENEPAWMNDEALARIAAIELNGRQIKNAVRTAHALATSEQKTLTCEHVEKTAATIRQFDQDIFNERALLSMEERSQHGDDERGSKRRRLV
jgi:hypothetical protein